MRSSTNGISRGATRRRWLDLAEQLGLAFEARAFLTIAVAVHPDRDDLRRDLARLDRREATPLGAGHALADVLAVETELTADPSSSAASIP